MGQRPQRVAGAAVLVMALCAGGAIAAGGTEKERAEVPEPPRVSHAGIRYEAVAWGRSRGLPQNGGYVVAVDEKTAKECWIVKVYDAAPDDGKEADKRDIFITEMKLEADRRHLHITNERGAVFRLDTGTRRVSPQRP